MSQDVGPDGLPRWCPEVYGLDHWENYIDQCVYQAAAMWIHQHLPNGVESVPSSENGFLRFAERLFYEALRDEDPCECREPGYPKRGRRPDSTRGQRRVALTSPHQPASTEAAQALRPGDHCVYRHLSESGDVLYVGVAQDFAKRMQGHRSGSTWWEQVATIDAEPVASREEALRREFDLLLELRPPYNKSFAAAKTDPVLHRELAE